MGDHNKDDTDIVNMTFLKEINKKSFAKLCTIFVGIALLGLSFFRYLTLDIEFDFIIVKSLIYTVILKLVLVLPLIYIVTFFGAMFYNFLVSKFYKKDSGYEMEKLPKSAEVHNIYASFWRRLGA